ncbi:hypothetical protein S101395_03509 [Bacillus sonorensis]|uniref:Uncharacterized protein n=1 Tax=Bacillus sonorensis TaxID=119858 RepID=A0ABM6LKX7_9BACI|nr:hypothetical protein S101395_03509 [Bacillus sonorensis]TWK72970.1 hypothetical protein CHCC20335_1635 [Bacillus paralicheniformis]GIN66090.1 hypothetical protein J41TS2_15110 [Bacillus sonorensis]
MCRLCKGHNSVYQDIGWGAFFSSCPKAKRRSNGDNQSCIKNENKGEAKCLNV